MAKLGTLAFHDFGEEAQDESQTRLRGVSSAESVWDEKE